jgi:hypothetical protein
MATITESIKADVPIEYADKEWTEYLFSSLYRAYADRPEDRNQESQKIDADSCTVRFVDESDETVNVSVTVECQVPAETERVREQLTRDLRQFREFLLRHCGQDGCRPG